MNEELLDAVRQALHESGSAAEEALHEILTVQAEAAVKAIETFGYVLPAGVEYAVKRGDVTEEVGFNTQDQAALWARNHVQEPYTIHRRPVGVWEQVDGVPGLASENPEPKTDPGEDKS